MSKPIAERNHSVPFAGMRLVTLEDFFREDTKPGSFMVRIGGTSCVFECPCGCGHLHDLPLNGGGEVSRPSWGWDGNVDAPTLTPSIRDVGACHFHGYLTAGTWTFCGDSGSGAER